MSQGIAVNRHQSQAGDTLVKVIAEPLIGDKVATVVLTRTVAEDVAGQRRLGVLESLRILSAPRGARGIEVGRNLGWIRDLLAAAPGPGENLFGEHQRLAPGDRAESADLPPRQTDKCLAVVVSQFL